LDNPNTASVESLLPFQMQGKDTQNFNEINQSSSKVVTSFDNQKHYNQNFVA
jgi:hypothetical protein